MAAGKAGSDRQSARDNRLIGARVRQARVFAGLSQSELGSRVKRTYQQIQKYESGDNRTPSDMLLQIARETGKPLAFFYADLIDPGEWGMSDNLMRALDHVNKGDLEFLERFHNMTGKQRDCVRIITEDLAAAYKHKSAG